MCQLMNAEGREDAEVEILDVVGTRVLGFLPCYSQSLLHGFYPPPPPSKSGLKLVCNVNIVYGNFKSENSQIMPRNLNEIVRS
jgi:hypothetical protein